MRPDIDAGPKTITSKTNGAHGTVAITNSGDDLTLLTCQLGLCPLCPLEPPVLTLARGRMRRPQQRGDHEAARAGGPEHDPYRETEIRQLLEARNARRAARGDAPLDIDAELASLTRPAVDDSLRAEIRSLVEARNARRIARGAEPLDVEAEVERRLSDLDG